MVTVFDMSTGTLVFSSKDKNDAQIKKFSRASNDALVLQLQPVIFEDEREKTRFQFPPDMAGFEEFDASIGTLLGPKDAD